jgi:hypothetical protein
MRHVLKLKFLTSQNGCHIFTSIRIFKKTYAALVDTGATASVFDVNLVQEKVGEENTQALTDKAGGVGNSAMDMHIAELKFTMGKKKFNQPVALIDFTHIHATYEMHKLPKFHFIIGNDILLGSKAIINYSAKTISLA